MGIIKRIVRVGVIRMVEIWNKLPKTAKVFFYLALSTLLAEILIELRGVEQTLIVRVLAQLINLGIVFLQEAVPATKDRVLKLMK